MTAVGGSGDAVEDVLHPPAWPVWWWVGDSLKEGMSTEGCHPCANQRDHDAVKYSWYRRASLPVHKLVQWVLDLAIWVWGVSADPE